MHFEFHVINGIDKYLGVPLTFGRSKKKHLNLIKERMIMKIRSWKEGLPSQVGRLTLIQSVLQAIPIYYF